MVAGPLGPAATVARTLRTGEPTQVRLAELVVRPRVVGPHARLGLAWAVVSFVALVAGPLALALLLAPACAAAANQAAGTWRRHTRRPARPVTAGGAGLLVLGAAAGPWAVVGVAALLVALVAGSSLLGGGGRRADPVLTLVITLAVGLAGAGPVLLRDKGLIVVMVLFSYAFVHDTAAYIVGTGARSAWEGPAAAAVSLCALTLAVAAVLVPPFRGASPWLLGALAMVLALLGPAAGTALLGTRSARAPALRRLDSLLLLGPVWALVAALVLD